MSQQLKAEPRKRKYQEIFNRLVSKLPEIKRGVTVQAASAAEVKKIRKAVWKEKDLNFSREAVPCGCSLCKNNAGAPIKEKYRLTCEITDVLMTFKLVLNQSSIHNL